MAVHLTNAQCQTIQAKTVGACKPSELAAVMDLLGRTSYVRDPDNATQGFPGADELTIASIFPSGAQQW